MSAWQQLLVNCVATDELRISENAITFWRSYTDSLSEAMGRGLALSAATQQQYLHLFQALVLGMLL